VGESKDSEKVSVAGRVMTLRAHGKSTFAHLQDGAGKIQVYLKLGRGGREPYADFSLVEVGDWIGVKGYPFKTRTGELTVHVESYQILSKALHPFRRSGMASQTWRPDTATVMSTSSSTRKCARPSRFRSAVVSAIRRHMDGDRFPRG